MAVMARTKHRYRTIMVVGPVGDSRLAPLKKRFGQEAEEVRIVRVTPEQIVALPAQIEQIKSGYRGYLQNVDDMVDYWDDKVGVLHRLEETAFYQVFGCHAETVAATVYPAKLREELQTVKMIGDDEPLFVQNAYTNGIICLVYPDWIDIQG